MAGKEIKELRHVRLCSDRYRQAGRRLAERRNAAIQAALDAGHSQTEVAAELGVSRQAVAHFQQRSAA